MPNRRKIDDALGTKIRDLAERGLNTRAISIEVGLARDTVKKFCIENSIVTVVRKKINHLDREKQFVEYLGQCGCLKDGQKKFRIGYVDAVRLAKENGYEHLLRDRAAAARDRAITNEEVKLRTPDGTEYLRQSGDRYLFKCLKTGKEYEKVVGKIWQGSPFGKSGHVTEESEYIERIRVLGYTLEPGTFSGLKKPVVVYCAKGHKRQMSRAAWIFKLGCPDCGYNGVSGAELDLGAFIKTLDPDTGKFYFPSDGKAGRRKEIDILSEAKKIGFEYCGLYWHNEDSLHPRPSSYHKDKMEKAGGLGYRLITIFEDEWLKRGDMVRDYIRSVFGVFDKTIGARECELREIAPDLGGLFYDVNHIQGASQSSLVYFGLFDGDDLLGVISGGRHPRNLQEMEKVLILDRLCFKRGVRVHGGASRLFKALVDWARSSGYDQILSWSDNRYSEGAVYEKLGFILDGDLPPDYSYVKGGKRYSKQSLKKTAEERASGKTETELRTEQGYSRIWDCGKKRWIFGIF